MRFVARPKIWMVRFKGVASNYLASYFGRHRLIERDGQRPTPRHMRAVAIGP